MKITEKKVQRLIEIIDHGLIEGLGDPAPGEMCVEAAVCYALGLKHSDEPACVHKNLQGVMIDLNDINWSTSKVRARNLKKLAIAQLGSNKRFNAQKFTKMHDCLIQFLIIKELKKLKKLFPEILTKEFLKKLKDLHARNIDIKNFLPCINDGFPRRTANNYDDNLYFLKRLFFIVEDKDFQGRVQYLTATMEWFAKKHDISFNTDRFGKEYANYLLEICEKLNLPGMKFVPMADVK